MKGLKVNVRVIGIGKTCRGFEGVIIEIIQLPKHKEYKIKWSSGLIGVYHSRLLLVWTPPPAAVANFNAEQNIQPVPAADIRPANSEENDGNGSGDESNSNVSISNYGSR